MYNADDDDDLLILFFIYNSDCDDQYYFECICFVIKYFCVYSPQKNVVDNVVLSTFRRRKGHPFEIR